MKWLKSKEEYLFRLLKNNDVTRAEHLTEGLIVFYDDKGDRLAIVTLDSDNYELEYKKFWEGNSAHNYINFSADMVNTDFAVMKGAFMRKYQHCTENIEGFEILPSTKLTAKIDPDVASVLINSQNWEVEVFKNFLRIKGRNDYLFIRPNKQFLELLNEYKSTLRYDINLKANKLFIYSQSGNLKVKLHTNSRATIEFREKEYEATYELKAIKKRGLHE